MKSAVLWGLLLLVAALAPRPARAISARPDWLLHPKVQDADWRYYIGRASAAATEAKAWHVATQDAYATAIRENFGFETRVQKEAYEHSDLTTSETDLTTRTIEASGRVEIHEFEQKDSYEETADDGKVNLWVLFRYRKSAIAKEKARLAAGATKEPEPSFSEQGSDADAAKGVVEITTHPEGAVVFIDGERYGKTPLRLKGQLGLGQHTVQLDHPTSASAEQQFLITPGGTAKVEVTLKPASAYLKIGSTPANASVLVDGKPVGNTPTELLTVPAGRTLLIELTQADSERTTEELTLDKGMTRELNLSLPVKPASLSVLSDPLGASVTVSSDHPVKLASTPTGLVRLDPGSYEVAVNKPGFQPWRTRVTLHGGDKTILPVVRLVPVGVAEAVPADAVIPKSPPAAPADDDRAIAARWRGYVYRGFPDTTETKTCYFKKKRLVQGLVSTQTSSASAGLKAVAEGRTDDPNYSAGERLVARLKNVEKECRQALLTSPLWDGTE